MPLICRLLFLAIFPVAEIYAAPIDDLYDDELLTTAKVEISDLTKDQLESFIGYLSTCGSTDMSAYRDYACASASIEIEIKMYLADSVLALVSVLAMVDRLGKLNPTTPEQKADFMKMVERQVYIERVLKKAAVLRYYTLIKYRTNPDSM